MHITCHEYGHYLPVIYRRSLPIYEHNLQPIYWASRRTRVGLSSGAAVSCKSVHESVVARVSCCPARVSHSLPLIYGHNLPLFYGNYLSIVYGRDLPLIYGHNRPRIYGRNLPLIYGHNLPLICGLNADHGCISQLEQQCLARVSTRVSWQECLPKSEVC